MNTNWMNLVVTNRLLTRIADFSPAQYFRRFVLDVMARLLSVVIHLGSHLIGGALVLGLILSCGQMETARGCPYGGELLVDIAVNGQHYIWEQVYDYNMNLITNIVPNGTPIISNCCTVAVATGGASICAPDMGGFFTNTENSAKCTITEDAAGFHVSHPKKPGSVTFEAVATYSCDGVHTQSLTLSGTIEVKIPPPPPGQDDACAGGCNGSCSTGLGDGEVADSCVDFRLPLGLSSMFDSPDFIWLYTNNPSPTLATPAALTVPFAQPGVEIITNNNGVLEQVKTSLGLVDVVSNTPYQYRLELFSQNDVTGTNAPYGTNGPAFTTWVVSNPDTNAAYNRLWITQQKPGLPDRQFKFTYTNSSTQVQRWDLLEPDGVTTVSTWQVPNATNSAVTNYYWQVLSGTNVIKQTCEVKQSIPIGNGCPGDGLLILSKIEGYGGTSNVTSYTYYPSNAPAGSAYQLQRADYPDGRWEYFDYDSSGRVITNYSTFANNAPPANPTTEPNPAQDKCKETYYTYDNSSSAPEPFEPTLTVVLEPATDGSIQEVSRIYRSVSGSASSGLFEDEQQCSLPGDIQGATSNLYTYTYYYDDTDPASAGRIRSISHSDGTATYYTYSLTSTNFNTVESTGNPDDWYEPSGILDGTRTTNVIDSLGRIQSETVVDIQSGTVLSQKIYTFLSSDPLGRDYTVVDLAGRTNQYNYACCGLESVIDPDDVATYYTYDLMNRQSSSTIVRGSVAVEIANAYDGVGRVLASERIGNDGSSITLNQYEYDALGRVIRETNALNGVITHAYAMVSNQQCITNTYPDGGIRIEVYYRDGRLQSVSGTAVSPVQYQYGVEQESDGVWREFTQEIKPAANGGTNEWTKTISDATGREVKTIYSGATSNACSVSSYSFLNYDGYPASQLSARVDADGVTTLYGYDDRGNLDLTAIDMNENGTIDYGGTDRITLVTNDVIVDHGVSVLRTSTYVWPTNSSDVPLLASTAETSTDGLKTWNAILNGSVAVTSQSVTAYGANGYRYETNTAPDDSYSVSVYQYGQLASVAKYDSTGAHIMQTTYGYDAHGRQNTITDARNGTTTLGYNNADLVTTNTTPNPGDGPPETTITTYNNMLQPVTVTEPDGTTVNSVYLPTGQLGLQYGSRTYPVAYSYDAQGRMLTMTNWSNYSGGIGARVTTWNYDIYRGWLTNKTYDGAAAGPSYTYTPAGRLATRTWARGITTTYKYDTAGGLTNVIYSDSTPGVTNVYDRLGRLSNVSWTNITETLTYDEANDLLNESYSGGSLAGLAITNGYDADLRRTALAALLSNNPLIQQSFGYDAASRLQTVSDGNNNTATYSYVANSPLVSQITFAQSGTTRMTTTKQYDYLNRLTAISNAPAAGIAVSHGYAYNSANQRTQDTLVDDSYWVYQYDSLGQVISGNKYWRDGTPVAGQQFGYTFDTIGNRTQTQSGGDQNGANLRTANYYANNLNQLTNRDVPAYVDVKGVSIATNVVTVNGQTAYRKWEYFRDELPVNNSASALWTNIVVTATGQTSVTGNVYVAQTPEHFSYDLDGNLTNDGRFAYIWDGENRLVAMTNNTGVGPKYALKFAYDAQGRRIEKFVATNGVPVYTNRFLYDGWNLIAELNPASSLVRSYMWGTDLSGSMQGAGGVGGLLEASYYGSTTTNCFVAYDGNGNVAALVNAADGTVAANYEYGPFGEAVRETGPMAKAAPFRFSTKYGDDESDLIYYGYRFYNPSTGMWPNRDPMEEKGGINLYSAFQDNPVNNVDFDGRFTLTEVIVVVAITTLAFAMIVHVGVIANKPIHHLPIQEAIVSENISDGKCKGAFDVAADGTIEQEPPLPLDGGLALKVVKARVYWIPAGKHTVHVWVRAYVKVQGSKNTGAAGKIIDQWDFTSDNLCCP